MEKLKIFSRAKEKMRKILEEKVPLVVTRQSTGEKRVEEIVQDRLRVSGLLYL